MIGEHRVVGSKRRQIHILIIPEFNIYLGFSYNEAMHLKVVTLNLWNGGRLLQPALDFLSQQQADIMFLQEAYNGINPAFEARFRTVTRLRHTFPDYSWHFAPTYLDTRSVEGPIEDGQLILSRWPLAEEQNLFFDIPYGEYDQDTHPDFSQFPANLQTAITNVNGLRLKLLNVHGPVNYDGLADTNRRLHMRDTILHAIEGESRVILAGDFNVRPETETIRSLSQVLQPLFAEGELATTFNMQRKSNPGFATAAVDNLFVSASLTVVDRQCPPVDISDHLPLVAELKL